MKFLQGIITAVGIIEAVGKLVVGLKGKDKQEGALVALDSIIPTINAIVGKEVLDVPEVKEAIKAFMDAAVALKNVIFKATGKEIF